MKEKFCCVCNQMLDDGGISRGGRSFCSIHYSKIHNKRKGLWLSSLIAVLGLIALIVLSFIFEKSYSHPSGNPFMKILAVGIALLPPVLWMSIFYQQDRIEPEPKSYVIKTVLLGALVQKAISGPVIALLNLSTGNINAVLSVQVILGIGIIAMIQETLKLGTMRHSVFNGVEFDEKTDGILYGAAIGLGFAAMMNLEMIFTESDTLLSVTAIRIVISSLSHASIGGLGGYLLGLTKFEKKPYWFIPGTVLVITSLNGFMQILTGTVARRGFRVVHMVSLIPAAIISILIFTGLILIIRRNERKFDQESGQPSDSTEIPEEINKRRNIEVCLIWVIIIVAFIGGLSLQQYSNRFQKIQLDQTLELSYPSTWKEIKDADSLFKSSEAFTAGNPDTFLQVRMVSANEITNSDPAMEEAWMNNAAAGWTLKSAREFTWYLPSETSFRMINGKPMVLIEYLYIKEDNNSLMSEKPVIGHAFDLLIHQNDRIYVVTVSRDSQNEDERNDLSNRIFDSIQLLNASAEKQTGE
jgi:RsiW-degrading membrane proteinase PrsW (M82 family)